jgi:molybdenum cofactor cytidylyltransferase
MKFGAFPVSNAEGMVLAHSVRLTEGLFRKGRLLTAADIRQLKKENVSSVYAASLATDDISEDEAARILAMTLAGSGVRAETPFTGRANLYATSAGVLSLDENMINQINSVNEAITVATLPNYEAVAEGQMLATVKIIPFAVPKPLLDETMNIASETTTALTLHPYRIKTADLILTTVPGMKATLLTKAEEVITARLAELGITLIAVQTCSHTEDAIAEAINLSSETSEMALILGASATGDRRDVVPAAIEHVGGSIKHFGMPVDPGNLLLLAEHGGKPILGLPGCARSPKLNGTDWVLQRLAAGLNVDAATIQAMGVGGLLKEIPSRPQPRDRKPTYTEAPRVAAIILGGGRSTRMGETNKLTTDFDGKPMIAHVADAALSSKADGIILVTGHEKDQVLKALAGRPMSYAHNPEFAEGLSTSIRAGIKAATELNPPVDAALILLGDMPLVSASLIDSLINAHDPEDDCYICIPTVGHKRGNPVLWDAVFFDRLQNLSGDMGAKPLIAENADLVSEVPVEGDASLTDFDTPTALRDRNKHGRDDS